MTIRNAAADAKSVLDSLAPDFPTEAGAAGLKLTYHKYLFELEHILGLELFRQPGRSNVRVLDVGAGAGVVPLALARLGGTATVIDNWVEYDPSLGNSMGTAAQILRRFERYGVVHQSLDIRCTPWDLPKGHDGPFDLVLFNDVIEHLTVPRTVLAEIRRLVRPGGFVVVGTPNLATLKNRLRALAGRSVHSSDVRSWFSDDPWFGHVREYTGAELSSMLQMAGFHPLALHWSNDWLQVDLANKTLRRRMAVALFDAVSRACPSCSYWMLAVASVGESGGPQDVGKPASID